MKNDAIAGNGSGALPVAWTSAIELLEQDLRRRGAAPGTIDLYRTDVEYAAELSNLVGAFHE